MAENVFLENKRKLSLTEYMNYNTNDRGNLGDQLISLIYDSIIINHYLS